ncbi:hypothetical protein FRX31_004718 [Thalictrum thalictroides]|uniref:Uncharacterized protein n=1 Tax=Thalictrum thalictroides TaxID=46969 RepID=A0A7J6X7K6_THATH|nr:hypothetical protein FRX31_004718 [Thalictrum thalictroides]
MEVPADCSWIWRGILNTRRWAKPFTRHLVADGTDSLFWHEPWTSLGVLRDHVDNHTKQLCGLREGAKVSEIIQDHQWK